MTRASVFQTVQLGLEVTPGTNVAANKKLTGLSIEPGIRAEIQTYRPMGSKYPTVAALGKEWTESQYSGPLTYTEIIYILSGIAHTTTPTDLGAGSGPYSWVFDPDSDGADTVSTFSIEWGDASRASELSYGIFRELGIVVSRDSSEVNGSILGQEIADGITLTAAPTEVPLKPVLPKTWDVFMDPNFAGLGVTQLDKVLSFEWRLGNRFGPLWTVDSREGSFKERVELVPSCEVRLMLEADAVGMGLLSTMRTGTSKYMRFKSTGELISGANYYDLQIDTQLVVTDVAPFSDQDGIYAIEWTFEGKPDTTNWNGPMEITVINEQATL